MSLLRTAVVRRVLAIGVGWAVIWLAWWAGVWAGIALVDPDSIDPDESLLLMMAIFGPMGFASGVLLGIFLTLQGRGGAVVVHPAVRVVAWGTLASALVQVFYLGHGDAGLVANIMMALAFSACGGLVTLVWLGLARGWSRRRGRTSVTPPAP